TLIISGESYFSSRNRHAEARSSTCKNSRRGVPDPHTTSSRALRDFASCALRRSAANTCDVSRSKLSFGPYRLVGMTEMKVAPYSRAYAWQSLMPAILAIRSEEHTSELQSLAYLVCRLL